MTLYEWAFEYCKERGMLEKEAFVVVESTMLHPATESIRERWGESVENYPEPMKKLLARAICESALAWIEKENPHAFFKPLFDGTVPS